MRLEHADRVIRQGPDRAAREARHALGRLDAPARGEGPDGIERVGPVGRLDRQVGSVGRDRDRPGLDAGDAVAHLEQAPRPDAEERIAAEPLAAFDAFEQVGRPAVVEAEECPDRGLEVRRARGAQQDRVGVGGQTLRLRQADRIGCGHRGGLGESRNDRSSRDERSCLPRCHPHSACAALIVTDGPGTFPWRSALPGIAGALRRSLLAWSAGSWPASLAFGPEAPGSIHRRRRPGFHQPPVLSADARRVLVPFTARIRISGADGGRTRPGRQAGAAATSRGIPWLEPRAVEDRQLRVARIADVRRRSLAQAEHRAAGGADGARMAAGAAQSGRRPGRPRRSRSRAVAGQPSALGRPRPAMAERVGFEPTKSFDSALFKSAAINRSATSPGRQG